MRATPKRRWFQFSLRTLFVVMTVLCLGPGSYVAYEQGKAREKQVAVAAIENLGGYVFYDERAPTRSGLTWLILGDDSFGNVNGVDFNPLKQENRQITDADLRHLKAFPRLNHLVLKNCCQITDAGLADLSGLANLQYLYLNDSPITDAGLVHLAGLTNLEELSLTHTQVTGLGLVQLSGLTELRFLYLYSTRIPSDDVEKIQKALPRCCINR
ncbi:MAG: leucine-rich repeat domain-containing protein [Pirellulaceae bacterium]